MEQARGSDRLLIGLLATIAVLVVAGLAALVLVGQRPAAEFPEDTPQGVVQRYLRALDGGDGSTAYSYISDSVKDDSLKRAYQQFSPIPADRTRRILLEGAETEGDQARVVVSISTIVSENPTSTSENTMRLELRLKREGSVWRITAPVYPPYLGRLPKLSRPDAPQGSGALPRGEASRG